MTNREMWVVGVEILLDLLEDDLILARALKKREYRKLLAAATIAKKGLGEPLAMSDPGLYKRLTMAIVRFNLKGYGALDLDRLATLAR